MLVRIDGKLISDWKSFHDVFKATFGFPDFYGNNMNAWIDCMSYLDCPGACMTSLHVTEGETMMLVIEHSGDFKRRCLDEYEALIECSAFVNWRQMEEGKSPLIALAFFLQ